MKITSNIINHIALQVVQTNDGGLFHGRMGIILALYCYGIAHDNNYICEYASDILQLTMNDYHDGDISLENGLSGIGLGVTLLYKAGLFNNDLNELLFDLDQKIMGFDPRRMIDQSFRLGISGVLYYIRTRLSIGQPLMSIHRDYIRELENNIHSIDKKVFQDEFLDSLQQPNWEVDDYFEKDAGIDNGCAYYLIMDSYEKVFSR